jgi:small-conductance mechanosensitive channel
MEDFKSRIDSGNRMNMVLGAVHQVAAIAIIAIIVFGDVASAADDIKRLVAFAAVMGAITSWIFTSNALKGFQAEAKSISEAEAATASGKDLTNQPWAIFQIYVLVVTVATIAVTLTAICVVVGC